MDGWMEMLEWSEEERWMERRGERVDGRRRRVRTPLAVIIRPSPPPLPTRAGLENDVI